jgi:hypothetical protein
LQGIATTKLDKSGNRDHALSKFASFPPDQQKALLEYLEELEVLEPSVQAVTQKAYSVTAYAWENEEEGEEGPD